MAKPKPPIAERKMRCTTSLAHKLVLASDAVKADHPQLNLRDFSDVVGRALYQYLEGLSPGVVARTAERLRAEYTMPEPLTLSVQESTPPSTYQEMKETVRKTLAETRPKTPDRQRPAKRRRAPGA